MSWISRLLGRAPKRTVDNPLTRAVEADPEGWQYFVDSMSTIPQRAKQLLEEIDRRKLVDSQQAREEGVE
jgi:hypothetical protein